MSGFIGTINGKSVYSDKEVDSVVNSKITFADGSWCDVETGEVHNKGEGFINIGSPGQESEKTVTKGPLTFTASTVKAMMLAADLDIRPHDGEHVEITITGPASVVDKIDILEYHGTLMLKGRRVVGTGKGITVISGGGKFSTRIGNIRGGVIGSGGSVSINGSSISVDGGGIFIGGSVSTAKAKVAVKVPKGTAIDISVIEGMTTIGDTNGPLGVSVTSGEVVAGKVTNATLVVNGTGDITVDEVCNQLTASVAGSGDIQVNGGQVAVLIAAVVGSGDINFRGSAENATLTVTGSGDIKVKNVKNQPVQAVTGTGEITVGNW